MSKSSAMTSQAAARIQASTAKANGGQVSTNSFAGRSQAALDRFTPNGGMR